MIPILEKRRETSSVIVTPRPIRTMLTIDRMRNGRIIERKQGWSRSFVKQFIDLLYVQMAGVVCTAPYVNNGVFGSTVVSGTQGLSSDAISENLRIACGGGDSTNFFQYHAAYLGIPGNSLGILLGADSTAVTPTDNRLWQVFHHGMGAAQGAGIIESLSPTDNQNSIIIGGAGYYAYAPTNLSYQGIFPARGFRATSAQMKLWEVGSPGICVMDLLVYDRTRGLTYVVATGTFNGNALGSSPGALAGATFTTPADLYANYPYIIRVSAPSGDQTTNYIYARLYNGATNVPRYNGPTSVTSIYNYTISGASQVELLYGGTEVCNLVVSNPTVTFDIVRYIQNKSGFSTTVNEVGIYASGGMTNGSYYYLPTPQCIARDVIAGGQVMNNGDTLKVTYTPSITV